MTSTEPKIFGNDIPKTMFLLLHTFQKSPEQFEEAYAGHRAYIDRNLASGRFLGAGPRVPWIGGVIMARASSREDIEAVVASDPLVPLGITAYELIEFKTTIRSTPLDEFLDADMQE